MDSVFVSRKEESEVSPLPTIEELERLLLEDLREIAAGGVRVSLGDARCLFSGHIARICAKQFRVGWDLEELLETRLARVKNELKALANRYRSGNTTTRLVDLVKTDEKDQLELFGPEEVVGAPSV